MQNKLSVNKAVFLTLIMILMTQTGYLENISNFEEIETNNFEKLSSNGGSNNLIPSVEGADLMVGDLMDDITFQYDSSAASGSGSGGSGTSGITTYGNGSTWNVVDLRGSQGSDPGNFMFMAVGDTLYFDADNGSEGRELWAYDTSNDSTWLVADIWPGMASSNPGQRMVALVGDTLYFDASDGTYGRELWAHDTSNHSTWLVADLSTGSGWSGDSEPGLRMAIVVGDTLYFDAYNTTTGRELWAHDTSNHSTWLVTDLVTNTGSSGNPGLFMSQLIGDTIYFGADADGVSGRQLWAHSTANGTTWLAADLTAYSANPGYKLSVVIGDTFYFDAMDQTDYNIYAYNTVNHSAWPVADIATVAVGSPNPIDTVLKASSNALYFSFDDGSTGKELWAFSFTNHSIWQVADIRSGGADSYPAGGIVVDDTLYFSADDGFTGIEFWGYNEINGTTWQVADLASSTYGDTHSIPGAHFMELIGDTIYFDALGDYQQPTTVGIEVWAYDTSNHSIWPATSNSFTGSWTGPSGPVAFINDTLYLTARSTLNGAIQNEVYAHQPSEIAPQTGGSGSSGSGSGSNSGTYNGNGTVWLTKDINPGNLGFDSCCSLTAVGDTIFFTANPGAGSYELWKSDGSEAGTVMVKQLTLGSAPLTELIAVGDTLFFRGDDGTHGRELWKSDGTAAGTVMVKDINPGSDGIVSYTMSNNARHGQYQKVIGDTLYFIADDGTHGRELWKSDGTAAGTVMVKDINTDSTGIISITGLSQIGDTLYFSAYTYPGTGWELWQSDGTAAGTVMIKDANTPNWMSIEDLTAVGDTLYFDANDGVHGNALYKSDGTASGIVMLKDINNINTNYHEDDLDWFTAFGDTLYFSGDDGINGQELWKSDGTVSGTVMVKNINPTNGLDANAMIISTSDYVLFRADDGTHGTELWRTDGTTSGTVMVKDILTGSQSSNPSHSSSFIPALGDTIFLVATDISGRMMWQSNGTDSGTFKVSTLMPSFITFAGNTTFFTADDGTHGRELWAYDPVNIAGLDSGSGSGGGITNVTGATCSVSPALPTGLNIDSNTCTISGTPSIVTSNTTYTITAVISGITFQTSVWLSSAYHELTPSVEGTDLIIGEAMDDITFQYDASAASGSGSGLTGVTTTYGNGSTWQVADIKTGPNSSNPIPNSDHRIVVDDTLYFTADDGITGRELWAYNTLNETIWLVSDMNQGPNSSSPNTFELFDQTIYFFAYTDTTGHNMWAYNVLNDTRWQLTDLNTYGITNTNGWRTTFNIADTLYFRGDNGTGGDLWAYNLSNNTPWQVSDTRVSGDAQPGQHIWQLVGDTIYFDVIMDNYNDRQLWAYDTSNQSRWHVTNFHFDNAGHYFSMVIDDTIYFDGNDGITGIEPWAYNTTNGTIWQLANINQDVPEDILGDSYPAMGQSSARPDGTWGPYIIGDSFYFDAKGPSGHELYGYNTSNQTVWQATDIASGKWTGELGSPQGHVFGDKLIFYANNGSYGAQGSTGFEWWIHDTSNNSTWVVTNIGNGYSRSGPTQAILVGDTLYFHQTDCPSPCSDPTSKGSELWAHDISNESTWQVADIWVGDGSGYFQSPILVGDTILFRAIDGITGWELWAHQPSEITSIPNISSSDSSGGMTNVNGAVCTVSPALPTGLNIDSSTCTISGTPSIATSNTTYTITANISGTIYQGNVWLATMTFGTITSPVMGAELQLGEAMTPIMLNYTVNTNASSGSSGSSSTTSFVYANDKMSVGSQHTCAILDNGDLKCWGDDSYGQLGNGAGSSTGTPLYALVDLGTDRTALAVSAGTRHTCAILDNGELKCWGRNSEGQIGIGVTGPHVQTPSSVDLGTGRTAVAVSAGYYHTCAILDNGDLKCWGRDSWGVLGDGASTSANAILNAPSSTPVDFGTGRTAVSVSTGEYNTCAILDSGDLKCWGDGADGQLGLGNSAWMDSPSSTSIDLGIGRTAVDVSVAHDHVCAILDNGDMKCWGSDYYGQLGDGFANGGWAVNTNQPSSTPIELGQGRTAVALNQGSRGLNTCAILDNGSMKCWGQEMYGMLGNGGSQNEVLFAPSSTPIDFGTGRTVVGFDHSNSHTCAVLDNGSMMCWGLRGSNLGLGSYSGTTTYPNPVAGTDVWDTTTTPVTWETHPALPAGISISAGTISGTPSVYALNQTYTIYANQSGYSTTYDLYFSVENTNPHTVVEDQPIDAIGFHPAFFDGTTTWSVSPTLPNSLLQDTATGEITGMVDDVISSTFTVTATHSSGAIETFTFSIDSLLDTDGDGLPNDLPLSYNPANPPTSGLIADDDDDGDGLDDLNETGTNVYVDESDTGTNPLNPDSDGDGICDGPNSVSGVCLEGPDVDFNDLSVPINLFALNGTDIGIIEPQISASGGTYEISPSLPDSLVLDPNTGEITGMPTETLDNTTFTMWFNHTDGLSFSWDFSLAVLEDSDGDGLPDELPDDYDSSNPDSPGLIEDLDDDNDGIIDSDETIGGTDPTNPDTDGDGMCDGPSAVPNVCIAGSDAFPLDPSADTDTDGDGMPDSITGDSTSDPALVEDLDDDGDGLDDLNETGTNVYVDESDTGTDSLNPDTDNDGICDGPLAVSGVCVAGPDENPLGEPVQDLNYLINNSLMISLVPPNPPSVTGVWEITPDLPLGLVFDQNTGRISGTPYEVIGNTTFTMYGNYSDGTNLVVQFNLQVLEDSDLDGNPDNLPEDYPDDGNFIIDDDDDNDGLLDIVETNDGTYNGNDDTGTDPLDADTDDDGVCDGPNAVPNICTAGPDAFPLDPSADTDTDGDGMPDSITGDSTSDPALVEDLDDDGDGLDDLNETGTNVYVDESDTGTDSLNPDTDGDGVCDGANSVPPFCIAGPDSNPFGTHSADNIVLVENVQIESPIPPPNEVPGAVWEIFPALPEGLNLDSSTGIISGMPTEVSDNTTYTLWANITGFGRSTSEDLSIMVTFGITVLEDTDGDGLPDELPDDYDETLGTLTEDDDDDNDGILDTDEALNGTNSLNPDSDGDGFCDGEVDVKNANNELICFGGPDPFPLDQNLPLDTDGDGMPDNLSDEYIGNLIVDTDDDNDGFSDDNELECMTDPLNSTSYPVDEDGDGQCDIQTSDDELTNIEDDVRSSLGFNWVFCSVCFLILLCLLLIPLVFYRDQIILMMEDGPEPENTTSKPAFISGAGTVDDPFILKPLKKVKPGSIHSSKEVIKIDNMSPITVEMQDFNEDMNGKRFTMYENILDESFSTRKIEVGENGEIIIQMKFDDSDNPTYAGGEFEAKIKLGKASVYLTWVVNVKPDKKKLKEAEEAEAKAAKEAEEAEAKAAKEAEEAEAKAAKEAEEAEKAKAAIPKEVKKQEELQRVKSRAESIDFKTIGIATSSELKSEIKEGATSLEVSDASEFNESGSAAISDSNGSSIISWSGKDGNVLTGVSGVTRIFGTASIIMVKDDLQVIKGIGPFLEEKLNALGITTYRQIANMDSKLEEQVNEAIEFFPGRIKRDQWVNQAKILLGEDVKLDKKALKKAEDLERISKNAAGIDFSVIGVADVSEIDDLQIIKGIGPFIAEKLNALGIYTFKQISKMNSELEDQVNIAIEFFPGRVKRDKWADQAKELVKK